MEWHATNVDTLRSMWTAGDSASTIGRALGCSRNAVIGKAHRLQLESRHKEDNAGRPRTRPYRDRSYRNTGRPAGRPPGPDKPPRAPRAEVVHILDNAIPPEQRRTVLTVGWNECHFPVGDPEKEDFFYCGGPVPNDDGRCYCEGHRQRMFLDPRRRSHRAKEFVNYTTRVDRYA